MSEKKRPYSVPEGYFTSLEMRLSNIPQVKQPISIFAKFRPYAALAACFCFLYFLGARFIQKPASPADFYSYEQLYYSDLIPWTDPYSIYEVGYLENEVSYNEEDIINYLIDSGTSIDFILLQDIFE